MRWLHSQARSDLAKCETYCKPSCGYKPCQEILPNLLQFHVILKLEARLQNRRNMHHVQEDFDGAQPRTGGRHVSLSDGDTALMWDLFDYAKVSSCQEHSSGSDMDGCADVQPAFPGVCPGCRDNGQAACAGADPLQNTSVLQEGPLAADGDIVPDLQWDNSVEGLEVTGLSWECLGWITSLLKSFYEQAKLV